MDRFKVKQRQRLKRHYRVRKQVFGTAQRPRLSVFRSDKHVYCQLIDDLSGKTLLALSTLTPEVKKAVKSGGNIKAASLVGRQLAEKSIARKITQVVFDRGPFPYHGRLKALAESARKGGLKF